MSLSVLVIAVLSSFFDRKYNAQSIELAQAVSRYRALIERSLAGYIRISTQGKILDCNEASVRFFGNSSRAEFMSSPFDGRFLNESNLHEFFLAIRKEKTVTNFECRLRKLDGSPVWLLASASLVTKMRMEAAFIEGTRRYHRTCRWSGSSLCQGKKLKLPARQRASSWRRA